MFKVLHLSFVACLLFVWASCTKNQDTGSGVPAKVSSGVVFPNTPYARVVAYHYEGDDGSNIIDSNQRLNDKIYQEEVLTQEQTERVLQLLNDPNSYGGQSTRCFKPHLGIVFYDAQNKPLAHTSICFMCNNQMASPHIQAEKQASMSGFSEQGRSRLMEFCSSLAFGHCNGKKPEGDAQGKDYDDDDRGY